MIPWQLTILLVFLIIFLFGALNLSGVFKWFNNRLNNQVAGSAFDLASIRSELDKIKIALQIRKIV